MSNYNKKHIHINTCTSIRVPVRVIRTSEARTSGAYTVTCTRANICNLVAVKIGENYYEITGMSWKVYITIAGNVERILLTSN